MQIVLKLDGVEIPIACSTCISSTDRHPNRRYEGELFCDEHAMFVDDDFGCKAWMEKAPAQNSDEGAPLTNE